MILAENSRNGDASCESESSSSSATRCSEVFGPESGEANACHSKQKRIEAFPIKKEERTVYSLKLLVLVCAVSVCIAIYVIARRNDTHNFELEVRFESRFISPFHAGFLIQHTTPCCT
jgi:hypothetical protein